MAGETPSRPLPGWLPWLLASGFAFATLALWLWPEPEPAATPVATATPAPTHTPRYYSSQAIAINGLLGAMGLQALAGPVPCSNLAAAGWRCETEQLRNWQGLLDINRPAVLTLAAEAQAEYVALLAIDGNQALLQTPEGLSRQPLMALGNQWNGVVIYLWQGAADFSKPLSNGDKGPLVNRIAAQFAELDQQAKPLTENDFNDRLAQRVRLFQAANGLEPDGIVGIKTLLKLNEATGRAITLTGAQALQQILVDAPAEGAN